MSYNKITIIGFVGKDPDVYRFQSGSMVVNFSVATSERGYTLQNGTNVPERTDLHPVKCTGRPAEFAEKWVKKGSSVLIEGRMHYDKRSNKNGEERIYPSIIAEKVEFFQIGTQRKDDGQSRSVRDDYDPTPTSVSNSDLPF